ncbi:hypothetical protein [Nocardiopsis sp. CNR-923]|uniref:hypothetical protein n=1 Tax=Nocardiopsis sp. CNR-923 TaxID=1904965 RepID=UPI00117E7735|nr:hypothetical protein [Nocardiopsis sp. CNR-923]
MPPLGASIRIESLICDHGPVRAVREVDLDIRAGSRVALGVTTGVVTPGPDLAAGRDRRLERAAGRRPTPKARSRRAVWRYGSRPSSQVRSVPARGGGVRGTAEVMAAPRESCPEDGGCGG